MQPENNTDSSNIEITPDLTIPKLFYQQTKRFGKGRVAMREKEFGIWRPITWHDYMENVKYLALGLVSIGLEEGDKERTLSSAEVEAYCASAEPMDKAGAYAIQGRAAMFVDYLEGSYSSVMGLPLYETAELLRQAGVELI